MTSKCENEVGCKKPPKASQFPKGKSGNHGDDLERTPASPRCSEKFQSWSFLLAERAVSNA